MASAFAAGVRRALWQGGVTATAAAGRPAAGRIGQAPRGGIRRYATEAGEEPKVNAWEAPTQIAKWKEEHIVFLVLGGWGVVIYGALKAFGGKKKEPVAAAAH
eukprot:jgi/Chlat1/6446/Chrsp45S06051